MKLKQYLGALLMAGSVLAFSFPAEAMSGKLIQRPFKRAVSHIVKSIPKPISKPVDRVIDLLPLKRAVSHIVKSIPKPINKPVDRAIDLRPPDTTKQITDYIHQEPTKLSQLVSHSAVEPTPRTEIEEEASQDIPKYAQYVISRGGAITVAHEAYLYLISPAGKSALILRGKEFACDLLLDDPVYVAVTVLQPNACPATKETIFIRKRLGYQK